jgi:hypothetical protein
MKRCPTCQRTYPDDAPAFCVNDGTRLVDEEPSSSYDPQKTIMSSAPPIPPPQIPPQYSTPASAPPIKPPTLQQQPPQYSSPAPTPPPPQQQPPVWPPPPQGQPPQAQNWGGYQQAGQYQNYPQQPYAAPAGGGKGFTLGALVTGLISALALGLIFAMANDVITPDYNAMEISYYGSAALGVIALILGILSLISRKQRSKWMAIVGMILGIPAILFFIYVQFLR